MPSPYYRVMWGRFVIEGYEPDGDSVRFIADQPALLKQLHRSYRIKLSPHDGSVQLRFEGVDAPELHYGMAAQPLGADARDALLGWMGFGSITYAPTPPTKVESAEPVDGVRGAILAQAAEATGRPVAYVLLETDAIGLQDGDWVAVDDALLHKTMNYHLLTRGMAYYTVYTSMPFIHRGPFRTVATAAREAARGVWAEDATSDFVLESPADIGPQGQIIVPKLFRRCTDYLKDVGRGFVGNLTDWLIATAVGSRRENDSVVIDDQYEVPPSDLLDQRNRHVIFQADVPAIVFVEE